MRRIKVFGLLIFLVAVTLLFWTASVRQQQQSNSGSVGDFYEKTVNGLNKNPSTGGLTGALDDDELTKTMSERLQEAAQVAKDKTNAKAPKPDPPSVVVGVGNSHEDSGERGVAGRKKFGAGESQEPVKEKTEEDHEVTDELNSILKKSPSKWFCLIIPPLSKKCLASLRPHFWHFL